MKKALFGNIFLLFFILILLPARAYTAERQEFISNDIPETIQKLLPILETETIGERFFSSTDGNIADYKIGFYNTNQGLLVALEKLNSEELRLELVGLVFVDKLLLWYKSETARTVLRGEMARLIKESSI